MSKSGVLFVDVGNILSSVMADAIFKDIIKKKGIEFKWESDSCGTADLHIGKDPDARASKVLKAHGIDFSHKGRQISDADYTGFHHILGMNS